MKNSMRVLVVDDSEDVRELVVCALLGRGYEVTQATDATDAKAKLRGKKKFHIVLSDLEMPGEDGFEVLQFARTSRQSVSKSARLFLMTGRTEEVFETMAKQAGAEHLFRKPFNLNYMFEVFEGSNSQGVARPSFAAVHA